MSDKDGRIVGTKKIVDNGPDTSHWNLVILSDGYRDFELPKFAGDAQAFVNRLFSTPPFDVLKRAMNVYRVDVASTESGADDPKTCGPNTGTGAKAATFFDATYCGDGNLSRLLTVNTATAKTVAQAQVSNPRTIMVLVNSVRFGGAAAGEVTSFAATPDSFDIGVHELGHAFGLADEYREQANGRKRHPGPEPAAANATVESNRSKIKWRDLIKPSTAVPTTSNPQCFITNLATSPVQAKTVGAFEEAHYFVCGAFRPEFKCKMRTLGDPFCAVCQRRIRYVLTPHMFGTPETFGSTWGTGWTTLMPFTLNGKPHSLAYKVQSGKMEIDRIRPDGSEVDTILETVKSSGWAMFIPFTLSGDQPHYLAYNPSTGAVVISRILPKGQSVTVETRFNSIWSKGWTSFMPFILGGTPHYMAYKKGTGVMDIDRILPDGSGVETVFTGTLEPGWTHFVPFLLNGSPCYFSYRTDSGLIHISRIRDDGQGVIKIFTDTWEQDWTSFAPFSIGGDQYHLAYKVKSGDAAIMRILPDGDGVVVDQPFRTSWTTGWTIIESFLLQGEPHCLTYKGAPSPLGSVSISRY